MAAWELITALVKALSVGWKGHQVKDIVAEFGGFTETIPINRKAEELAEWSVLKERIELLRSDRLFDDVRHVTVLLPPGSSLTYYASHGDPKRPMLVVDAQNSDEGMCRALVRELKSLLPVIPECDVGRAALADQQVAGFQFAERTIASFATEAARLSQDTTRIFGEFMAGVKQRTLELEAQFQTRHSELETAFRERQRTLDLENQSKLKEIEGRENIHAEMVKQFELRNNTAVRRDLLETIRGKIEEQKKIEISPETLSKRQIIHWICSVTLGISAVAIGVFIWKLIAGETADWKLLVPLSTWTAILVSTSIYYIRWNDQWFRDHAKVEFENRKFSADILRASWVAELLFEWVEKKGIAMPPELVASFTRNLFEGLSADSRLHPADQLTELLRQVSSLEVSKGAIKMTKTEPKAEPRH